jgi:hypothetical protein
VARDQLLLRYCYFYAQPMMTPEVDIKVRRLENDVHAIYTMVGGISAVQKRQGDRLEEIFRRQIAFHITQQRQGNRLEEIATDQAAFQATQERQGERLDEVATDQASLALEQASLASGQAAFCATQECQGERLEEIAKEQAAHRKKLDQILEVLRSGHPARSG